MNKKILLLSVLAIGQCLSLRVAADPVSGKLYYTRYADAPNVKSVTFSYDGTSTFTLGSPLSIGTTPGADGIVGNPQNSDLLIIGGQGADVSTISRTTGAVTTYGSPASVFHLTVPDSTTLLASGIPGALARHTILGGGGLSPGTLISLSGDDTMITTVISTPTGFYYTMSGPGGFGTFGTVTFDAAVGSATSATTTRLFTTSIASAHGGAYDPFTGDVMLFGDGHIGQFDIGTGTLVQRAFSGQTFDQGSVDGLGHMYVASNTGHLTFMDYSATSSITAASNFVSTTYLDSYLDDVAPLIGTGGTSTVPDAGSTMLSLGAALGGLAWLRRGRNLRKEQV